MAERRFYFWESYERGLATLPTDADRGEMVRAMCSWAFRGEEPDFSDRPQLETAWAFISGQLKASVEIGEKSAEGGRRSGETRRNKSKANPVPKGVPKGVPNDMNGHEMNGHESGSFHEPVAGFAPAPDGAGSPAEGRESYADYIDRISGRGRK